MERSFGVAKTGGISIGAQSKTPTMKANGDNNELALLAALANAQGEIL
jgi:hypothetical protein